MTDRETVATGGSSGRNAPRARRASQRVRHPTEVRRPLIVEAARSVIAQRGLFATTTRDIAQASDVSLGTVTYHFSGIADILAEVLRGEMDLFYAPIIKAAAEAPDGRTALRVIIEGFIASRPRAKQHWLLWLDFWALSAHDRTYARWQTLVYTTWRTDVTAVFERGERDGTIVVADRTLAVTEFMAIFDGIAGQAYLPGATLKPMEARRILQRYVGRLGRTPSRDVMRLS